MIRNFGDRDSEKFATEGKNGFSGLDAKMADQRIAELNTVSNLPDLAQLGRRRLHKLKGPLKDFWSMDINGPWRLIFRFKDGDAFDVRIVDTH